jgi:hypothetical protein
LNQHVVKNRDAGQRQLALETLRRLGPWLLAAALFLLSELEIRRSFPLHFPQARHVVRGLFALGVILGLGGIFAGGWLVAAAAAIRCVQRLGVKWTLAIAFAMSLLAIIAFWIAPAGLQWFHVSKHQPMAWAVFYPLAVLLGWAVSRMIGARAWREHAMRVLWVVAVAIWLLAYFGPYNYALPGRSTKIVLCLLVPLVIVLAGGFRALLSWPTLCFLGLLPFVTSYTSSFNIEYRLTDAVAEMPFAVGLVACVTASAVAIVAASAGELRLSRGSETRSRVIAAAGLALWLIAAFGVFQFDAGKLLGVLLATLWLIGCVVLFRRARIARDWFALIGAVLLFIVLHFVLNGFALSHVDFRFATNKIIPVQAEAWRAPQLIVWALVKYLWVLLPIFAVLVLTLTNAAAMQLFRIGCWRELMIVLSALGLALFDRRGMDELCSEEIYFWSFLNFAFWLLCLVVVRTRREKLAFPLQAESIPAVAKA